MSRHGWGAPATEYALRDYPATAHVLRTRTPGQVVVGDPASDPAEVALLCEGGFEVGLLVPLVFGGRDAGLLELFRRRPVPFSAGEIDRALLIAHQLGGVLDLLERAARRTRSALGQPPGATLRGGMAILVDELREYPGAALALLPLVPPGDGRRVRGAARLRAAGSACGARGSTATTTTCRRPGASGRWRSGPRRWRRASCWRG